MVGPSPNGDIIMTLEQTEASPDDATLDKHASGLSLPVVFIMSKNG